MAKSCSFDIVSEVDLSEVRNAVNQAMMEIRQRFDFKNSKSNIELEEKDNQLVLVSDDEIKLKAVIDILQGKLIKRKVPIKALDYRKVEAASGDTVRQIIGLQQGIPQDKGKEIVKFIKGLKVKVQGQVMDDQVRVTGKNRDDLQAVIAELKDQDFDIAMSFTNYR
ncbi:YajQ family cyclic di-GMP-binding protein [Nitrospina watsonii]|uniref:Nucleotide-binding protein NSPWAT_0401 n=1 Tax=Nitrospina watsonii TaxID=1323948 RepID=A0ABM9HAV7_9BACT|nr:YajQ family cyclic di-GMP-binding protein [Nitrospina watsonii]CAI2717260.1 putative nucleotide binding protein [Nitrospina watsonii]